MPNESIGPPAPGEDIVVSMTAEKGTTGLKAVDGVIYEDSRKDLQWPRSNKTYLEMSQDATISAASSLFEMLISRVPWEVKAPNSATEEQKKQANFISQCKDDMEHTWLSFIKEVTSMFTYGFCVNEKVFRRRRYDKGSKYNDGLVGIKKLAVRSQTTISKWIFKNAGRDLWGLEQDTSLIQDNIRFFGKLEPRIKIKRDKFLLFRTDVTKDNPQGKSPLSKVWTAWQFRKQIEEAEAIGTTRGLGGIPYFRLHPKYMSPNATDEEKLVYENVKQIGRNLQNNEQACVVFPALYDDKGKPLFDFELIGPPNASQYDTNLAIVRWDNKILQALFADLLQMGNGSEGSHNLAENKTSMVSMAVETRLREIQDVLNNDLIPHLFKLNGWDLEVLPKFQYGRVLDQDLQAFSGALQRIGAIGMGHITAENINYINEVLGLPSRVDESMSIEELKKHLTNYDSKAAQGMENGTGSGTAKSESGRDNSVANKENK